MPVTTDPDVAARLMDAFEGDIPDGGLVAFARTLGATPPDDRPGWDIVHEYGPDMTDLGLRWYQPADDPLTRLDY